VEKTGVRFDGLYVVGNSIDRGSGLYESSTNLNGASATFTFQDKQYTIRLYKYVTNGELVHDLTISSDSLGRYTGYYIYKYILFCALDVSKLKGSYFTMPRKQYQWDIKAIEPRTFDDIFLPNNIMEDLHLFVDIYEKSGNILRYLKVGNPGVGKTEATIILANELNKLGVTIIKTPICELLHEKVELANLLAPSLIIFDDIDLSLGNRDSGGWSSLLGDFLDVLDGTDKLNNDVGIIATTNAAHLLDLAAQRPGRFDKTLLFDDITNDNVGKIIKKSLKQNFKLTKGKEFNIYTDKRVVDKFYDARVSGAHIFNSIKMLKLRYDTLETKNVGVNTVLNSIDAELDVIDKIRKSSQLKSKFDRSSNGMGYETNRDNGIEVELTENEPVPQEKKTGY